MRKYITIMIAWLFVGLGISGGCANGSKDALGRRNVSANRNETEIRALAPSDSPGPSDAAEAEKAEKAEKRQIATTTEVKRVESRPTSSRQPIRSIGSAVLTINSENITADDLIRRIRPQLELLAVANSPQVFRTQANATLYNTVRDLVHETLLLQQITGQIGADQEPAVQKAVDQAIENQLIRSFGGSRIRWEKHLGELGISIEQRREDLRRAILTQQYLTTTIKPKVIITRQDLWQYYRVHQSEFTSSARVHLLMIDIEADKFLPTGTKWASADADQRQKARAKAKDQITLAQNRLAKGEEFEKVARELATSLTGKVRGGDMGLISKGSLRTKEIEKAAFGMTPGQTGEPIKVDRKYYLIRVKALEPARHVSFSQAQRTIKPRLENEIYMDLVNEHLAELRAKARISPIEPFLRAAAARIPDYQQLRSKGKAKVRSKRGSD